MVAGGDRRLSRCIVPQAAGGLHPWPFPARQGLARWRWRTFGARARFPCAARCVASVRRVGTKPPKPGSGMNGASHRPDARCSACHVHGPMGVQMARSDGRRRRGPGLHRTTLTKGLSPLAASIFLGPPATGSSASGAPRAERCPGNGCDCQARRQVTVSKGPSAFGGVVWRGNAPPIVTSTSESPSSIESLPCACAFSS